MRDSSVYGFGSFKPLVTPGMALRRVTSKTGMGVYASSDTLFKGAVFGRDSVEVAEDLLDVRPKLVGRIVMTLASLQGEETDEVTEEEPGKIIHEYRTVIVDGKRLDDTSYRIFHELSRKWGGDGEELAYYGSIDVTPHFIRLVGKYVESYGPSILDKKVTLRSGHRLPLKIVVENSVSWLNDKLDRSRSGLLEYQRVNPEGIENQVWKDSKEFYVHESGEFANHNAPIGSIEVQGLAYDALMTAGRLFTQNQEELWERAHALRDRTIELLWQPERNYFALGTDYSPEESRLRIINTATANPAALLDTGLFDDLSADEQELFVGSIIKKIMSPDFLTDAGIRSRALSAGNLVAFWDYHGSYVTWPKETYDIAKGLRRQHLPQLARELENRLLNITLKSRQYPEFVYVDEWGRVLSAMGAAHEHGFVLIEGVNSPERIQAWTVSAIMAIISKRLAAKVSKIVKMPRVPQAGWQTQLEHTLLTRIPRVNRLFNPRSLAARYPTYKYRLSDKKEGPSQ